MLDAAVLKCADPGNATATPAVPSTLTAPTPAVTAASLDMPWRLAS